MHIFEYFQFLTSGMDLAPYAASYNLSFVALSYLIVSLAAYTAIEAVPFIKAAERWTGRTFWLVSGSIALVCGIWGMHFIGMLAYHIPVPISYEISTTAISFVPAAAASGVMLYAIAERDLRKRTILIAALVFGLGVALMHFTGMAAMEVNALMRYEPLLFVISIIAVMALAVLALFVRFVLIRNFAKAVPERLISILSALLMGGAVAGMHYTAMAAVKFYPSPSRIYDVSIFDETGLALAVGGAVVTLLAVTLIAAYFQHRLQGTALAARLSQSRLADAIESASEAFTLYDADDRLVLYNSSYARMFKQGSRILHIGDRHEDTLRKRVEQELVDATPEEKENVIRQRLKNHAHADGIPVERQLLDGRWIQITHDRTSDGGTVTVRTDITERKRMEESMRSALEQAEVADRSKSEFIANMSHELRTPLNAVIGFSDIMMKESYGPLGNKKYREYAEDINASGQHLLDLISDILDLSKVEAGKTELHEEKVDPVDVVHSCMSMVRGQVRSQGLELVIDMADKLPWLRADQLVLKQIIINLFSNAVKFTHKGGKVTVKAWCNPKSGFVFQVIDTGIGISLEDIPKVMQPFAQIDSALGRKHQGTGLGLPLAKRMVELHGGSMDIQSEVGAGTTVTVRLPAERIVQAPQAHSQINSA